MLLNIVSYFWSINRVTGKRSTKLMSNEIYEVKSGLVQVEKSSRRQFSISEVESNQVTIEVLIDEEVIKEFVVTTEYPYTYKPLSAGGGYYYVFSLIENNK